jgi:hypothetical protein
MQQITTQYRKRKTTQDKIKITQDETRQRQRTQTQTLTMTTTMATTMTTTTTTTMTMTMTVTTTKSSRHHNKAFWLGLACLRTPFSKPEETKQYGSEKMNLKSCFIHQSNGLKREPKINGSLLVLCLFFFLGHGLLSLFAPLPLLPYLHPPPQHERWVS